MLSLRPARRSPRVLAVRRTRSGAAIAVVDPWEIRSAGIIRSANSAEVSILLAAAFTRERPTVLAVRPTARAAIERLARGHAEQQGVAVAEAPDDRVIARYLPKLGVLFRGLSVAILPSHVQLALATAVATLHRIPIRSSSRPRHGRPMRRARHPR